MTSDLRNRLKISEHQIDEINALLLDPNIQIINDFLSIVEKHGTVEEINNKARQARCLPNLLARLKALDSPYLADLHWLAEQRDQGPSSASQTTGTRCLGDDASATSLQ